jgi:hypothetical protein
VQVGDGLFTLLKDFALQGGDLVMQGDGAVLADFHGDKKYFEGLMRTPLSEKAPRPAQSVGHTRTLPDLKVK